MAKILCVTDKLTGILNTSLELLCRLSAAGHQVAYAGFEETRAAVEAHDIPFFCLPESGFEQFQQADNARSWVSRLGRIGERQSAALRSLKTGEFAHMLHEYAPDLLLVDGEMHPHIMTAVSQGQPLMLLNTFVSIWRSSQVPPPHWRAMPGHGWRGTGLAMRAMWLGLDVKRWQLWQRRRLRCLGCDPWTIYRKLAPALGLDYRALTDRRQWLLPFTYRSLPALCLHARDIEFPATWPAHVHFAGPLISPRRSDPRVKPTERKRLDELLARCRVRPDSERLIYAGFGSFFTTRPDFLNRLLEAARLRPQWYWIISVGAELMEAVAGNCPANVLLMSWAPQTEVLAKADLAITHTGANTLEECMLAGVPMLNYPGKATDMAGSSSRAEYHGVALTGDLRRDQPEDILAQLDRLAGEPEFAANARRMQAALGAYQARQEAERIIAEQLAASPAPGLSAPASTLQ